MNIGIMHANMGSKLDEARVFYWIWILKLDNILKFSFCLNFIYQVKNWLLIYKYKKKNSKIPSKSEEIIHFC